MQKFNRTDGELVLCIAIQEILCHDSTEEEIGMINLCKNSKIMSVMCFQCSYAKWIMNKWSCKG